MTPPNYHLFMAYNDWLVENNKPIEICVSMKGLNYPFLEKFVVEEKVNIDISPREVKDFSLCHEYVCFTARFDSDQHYLEIPLKNVLAFIYCHDDERICLELPHIPDESPSSTVKKPILTVVK